LRDFYIDISAREEAEKKDEIVEKEEKLINFISLITDKTKLETLKEKSITAIKIQKGILEKEEERVEAERVEAERVAKAEATEAEVEAEVAEIIEEV
jgi:oligoribonuclease (3'-5' exoribonuclease)